MPGSRQRSLLARLALGGPGGVRREVLIADLWGEAPPRSAANAVQVVVSALRGIAGADLITTVGVGYALAADVETDAIEFERELTRAEGLTPHGDPAEAFSLLSRALSRCSAEPLLDVGAPFATLWRSRLENRRLDAVELQGTCLIRLGNASSAIDLLAPAVASHPYREGLAAVLMRALGGAGRQQEALALFDAVRQRLVNDMGIDPGEQLTQARLRLLRGETGDDSRGRRVSLRTGLRELPASIVGRTEEIQRVSSMLARADVRLVTLLGPGGVGKTRLAQELVRASPADAVLVPLAGASGPNDLLPLISATLEIGPFGANECVDVADAIRAHGRPLLLVLDGFDHVRAAAAAVADLLAAVPSLRIVATSRSPLGLPAEHRFEVEPLPCADTASPSVQLLADRIRAQHPSVLATEGVDVRLAAIAELCAGLPLALELAASRTGVLGLDELQARLRASVVALDEGEVPTIRSLTASVTSSLAGLSGTARQVLDAATAFRDGFVKEDLASVAGVSTPTGETALAELLDRSLIRAAPSAGAHRFLMLDPIRDVVAARMTPTRSGRIATAHMRRFEWRWCRHDWVEHFPATGAQLRAIAIEVANLQVAVETARQSDPGRYCWMVARLSRAWDLLGRSAERDRWRSELLADPALPARLRFDLLVDRPWPSDDALAAAAKALEDFDDPVRRHALTVLRFERAVLHQHLPDALRLRTEMDSGEGVSAGALRTILGQADAMLAVLGGDFARAILLLRRSRTSALERGSEIVARGILRSIGEVNLLSHDPDAAVTAASAVLDGISTEHRSLRASALSTLGAGLLLRGDDSAARNALDEAIELIPTADWSLDVDDTLLRWSAARAAGQPDDEVAGRVYAGWCAIRQHLAIPAWAIEDELRTRFLASTDAGLLELGAEEVGAILQSGDTTAATRRILTLAQRAVSRPAQSRSDGRSG